MENRNFHTWKVVSQQVSCPPRARLPARNGLVNEVDVFRFISQRLIRLRNRWLLRSSPFEYLCFFTIGFSASPTNSNWVTRPYNPRERVDSVNETFICLLSQSHPCGTALSGHVTSGSTLHGQRSSPRVSQVSQSANQHFHPIQLSVYGLWFCYTKLMKVDIVSERLVELSLCLSTPCEGQ